MRTRFLFRSSSILFLLLVGFAASPAMAQRPRSLESRFATPPRGALRGFPADSTPIVEMAVDQQELTADPIVGEWETGEWDDDDWESDDCTECGGEGCPTCGEYAGGRPGAWVGGAEYLYVRPTFSEAIGYVQSTFNGNDLSQTRQPYDFGYGSSVRAFVGYRLTDSGGEILFTYTNLGGDATARSPTATGSTIYTGQLEINTDQGESLVSTANVDLNTYDLDFSKSIRLGDWGDGCAVGPRWDVKWSAGVRIADVDTDYGTLITNGDSVTSSGRTNISLTGAGPRLGLLGKRTLGQRGWLSVFARGNISLLLSNYEVDSRRITTGTSGSIQTETASLTRIIPVTEIEVGTTVRLAPRTTLVAGYLFQAWNDMGITQGIGGNLPSYDTANILSFDGLFLRGEWTY
ncbi:MAG: Lpg1974 family pore-forming outer membrane protein [Pirellulales bacterium]